MQVVRAAHTVWYSTTFQTCNCSCAKTATAAVPKPLPNPDVGGEDSHFINYRILCVFCTDNYTFRGYLFFFRTTCRYAPNSSRCAQSAQLYRIFGFVFKFTVLIGTILGDTRTQVSCSGICSRIV